MIARYYRHAYTDDNNVTTRGTKPQYTPHAGGDYTFDEETQSFTYTPGAGDHNLDTIPIHTVELDSDTPFDAWFETSDVSLSVGLDYTIEDIVIVTRESSEQFKIKAIGGGLSNDLSTSDGIVKNFTRFDVVDWDGIASRDYVVYGGKVNVSETYITIGTRFSRGFRLRIETSHTSMHDEFTIAALRLVPGKAAKGGKHG